MKSVKIRKSRRTLLYTSDDVDNINVANGTDFPESRNVSGGASRLKSVNPNLVQIMMQNTSVVDGASTRLIYSVHLGGKAVPAESAARDMTLLSAQEVALELGTPVIIQSQRMFHFHFYTRLKM